MAADQDILGDKAETGAAVQPVEFGQLGAGVTVAAVGTDASLLAVHFTAVGGTA